MQNDVTATYLLQVSFFSLSRFDNIKQSANSRAYPEGYIINKYKQRYLNYCKHCKLKRCDKFHQAVSIGHNIIVYCPPLKLAAAWAEIVHSERQRALVCAQSLWLTDTMNRLLMYSQSSTRAHSLCAILSPYCGTDLWSYPILENR